MHILCQLVHNRIYLPVHPGTGAQCLCQNCRQEPTSAVPPRILHLPNPVWLDWRTTFFKRLFHIVLHRPIHIGALLEPIQQTACYPPRLNWLAYLFFSVPTTVFAIVLQHTSLGRLAYSYASPFVIIAATALLLAFANTRIPNNRCINWVAASSFAIFLLHIDPHIFTSKFKYTVTNIYASTDGILCLLYIGCFLLLVALAAILIDQIRIMLWNLLSQFIERMGEKHEAIRRVWNYKSSL